MKSRIMAGPNDPQYMEPRWPGTNLPISQPLPAGSTVATELEQTVRWDPQKALEFLGTAAEAQKQAAQIGIELPGGIDFGRLAAAMSAGAAAGALAGGVGAIVGAAVGLVYAVWTMFANSGQSTTYANAEVHNWATRYAPQAFIDDALAAGTNTWTTIPQIARAVLLWWLERDNVVLMDYTSSWYNGEPDGAYINSAGGNAAVADMYKQVGVDYWATRNARQDQGRNEDWDVTIMFRNKVNLPANAPDKPPVRDGGGNPRITTDQGSGGPIAVGLGIAALVALLSSSNSSTK